MKSIVPGTSTVHPLENNSIIQKPSSSPDPVTDEEENAIKLDLFAPLNIGDKIFRSIGRPILLRYLFPFSSLIFRNLSHNRELYANSSTKLNDFRARKITISLGKEGKLIGHLIKASDWNTRKKEKHSLFIEKLNRTHNLDLSEENIRAWNSKYLSLKDDDAGCYLSSPLENNKKSRHLKGCLFLLPPFMNYEFSPKAAAPALEYGMDVFMFNYRGVSSSKGTANFKNSCRDTVIAAHFLKNELKCDFNQLVGYGYCFGASPLVYAAAHCKGFNIVLDRTFCRISEAIPHNRLPQFTLNLATTYMERFYPYPNEDLLPHVLGEVVIMQAKTDNDLPSFHSERLFAALVRGKLGKNATENEIENLKRRSWITVEDGNHNFEFGDKGKTLAWDFITARYNPLNEEKTPPQEDKDYILLSSNRIAYSPWIPCVISLSEWLNQEDISTNVFFCDDGSTMRL